MRTRLLKDIALTAGVAYDDVGRARAGMGVDVASPDNDRARAAGW